MGTSPVSKIAKRVAKTRRTVLSPREKQAAPLGKRYPWRQPEEDIGDIDQVKIDQFSSDWFPTYQWQQYPVRGDPAEMGTAKRAKKPIRPQYDPDIPALASKEDNEKLLRDMSFVGKGLRVGPDPSTQYPRLKRDDTKMPKSRISLPEKKLHGFLDYNQFFEMYKKSETQTISELANFFETQEMQLEAVLRHTKWIAQPPSSIVDPSPAQSRHSAGGAGGGGTQADKREKQEWDQQMDQLAKKSGSDLNPSASAAGPFAGIYDRAKP